MKEDAGCSKIGCKEKEVNRKRNNIGRYGKLLLCLPTPNRSYTHSTITAIFYLTPIIIHFVILLTVRLPLQVEIGSRSTA